MKLPKTLPVPELPNGLDPSAQWLAGEGAGSWFVISKGSKEAQYLINRYAPDSTLECSGVFTPDLDFLITEPFMIDYPSHCAIVTLIQTDKRIVFTSI